jgi:hypothetical protein
VGDLMMGGSRGGMRVVGRKNRNWNSGWGIRVCACLRARLAFHWREDQQQIPVHFSCICPFFMKFQAESKR